LEDWDKGASTHNWTLGGVDANPRCPEFAEGREILRISGPDEGVLASLDS